MMAQTAYRPRPPNVHRSPPPDANAARRHWRDLAAAALSLAASAEASEGREISIPFDLRHQLAAAPAYPVRGDAAGEAVAKAFREVAKAMLAAGTPRRRAILSPALAGLAQAVDELLTEAVEPHLALSRRIAGDFEED